MDVAGLALSALSAAQLIVECGIRVHTRIKDEKKLNQMVREFQMFEVHDRRSQLTVHIELAQGILKSQVVDKAHKERLNRQWNRITEHLSKMDHLSDEMIKNSSIWNSRARHTARDELGDLGGDKELSEMLREFQDAVMALRELMKDETPLFLSGNDFTIIDPNTKHIMLEPGTFLSKGRLANPHPTIPPGVHWFLFESKPYLPETKDTIKQNVHILSRKLNQAQPERGIFKLLGFRDEVQSRGGAFQLVFTGNFSENPPLTLSACISGHPSTPSLNFRISLCYQLAAAVLQTHTLGLVHKNIKPENIIMLQTPTLEQFKSDETPEIYLSGWQYARQAEHGVTDLTNQVPIQRRIYQHPERQLPTAEKEYSMAHDVHSLGVCMLEILNWESILASKELPYVSQAFIDAFEALELSPATNSNQAGPYTKFPDQIKSTLVRLNDNKVPIIAGLKMSNLIRGFLTCLDEEEDENGLVEPGRDMVVHEDQDRRRIAMRFVNTALKTLRSIQCSI